MPVLMCVAVVCSKWQCAAGCCSVLQYVSLCDAQTPCYDTSDCLALTSQCVAVCCIVLQCLAVASCSMLQCLAVSFTMLQCLAVCCSVLHMVQCVAVR